MVQLTCPCCRKSNELLEADAATCARCGCDLSSLLAVRRRAKAFLDAALTALRARNWSLAREYAERSWSLQHSAAAARVAALACGALGQVEELVGWRRET
jgi:hypothetical protein